MGKLDGKVAVITGGSSGIGRSTALALAGEGAAVAISGRNASALEEVAGKIKGSGARVLAKQIDVRKERDIIDLIDGAGEGVRACRHHGEQRRRQLRRPNHGRQCRRVARDAETNILALLIGSREAVRVMKQNTPVAGDIINISSNATKHDIGKTGNIYAATKHAVNAIGDGLRAELKGSGIRVTTILPAMTLTNFARNWPQEMLDTAARFVGMDPEKEGIRRGQYLPQEGMDRTLREHPGLLLSPDDLANAVLYAVMQPPSVHIDEVLVRPSIGVNLG